MKSERQSAILEIIASKDVETQFQMIDELKKVGFNTTQATLSRDVKEMFLNKELTAHGKYRYVVGAKPVDGKHLDKLKTIFKESVISCACAKNIVVVKTLPGLAPAACSAIDSMAISGLVGSIAGDDTGFLAMRDTETAEKFCKEIQDILRG